MDSDAWREMLDARRAGSGERQRDPAPLPPDSSEVERYVSEHSTHPGFRALAEVQPGIALIRCKHIGEVGRDFLTPMAEARELCARYGSHLIPRDRWAPGQRAPE